MSNPVAPAALTKTFQELYSDPANNPLKSNEQRGHEEIFLHWRTADAAPSPQQVLDDAMLDLGMPSDAIVGFQSTANDESGILKVLHAPRKHVVVLGQPATRRGRAFAHEGDVLGVDIDSVALDVSQFTGQVWIPEDFDRTLELFSKEPNVNFWIPSRR